MLNLPPQFILFDTEFTAWEGSKERGWTGPNEYKEIVQIGAIKVETKTLAELDSFQILVKPKINPVLSDYFINLTGINQDEVDKEGVDFSTAVAGFKEWCQNLPLYCFGSDARILEENCKLLSISFPFLPTQFNNIKDFFKSYGVPADNYYSSTIVEFFNVAPSRQGHDSLNDVRTLLDALKELNKSTI